MKADGNFRLEAPPLDLPPLTELLRETAGTTTLSSGEKEEDKKNVRIKDSQKGMLALQTEATLHFQIGLWRFRRTWWIPEDQRQKPVRSLLTVQSG